MKYVPGRARGDRIRFDGICAAAAFWPIFFAAAQDNFRGRRPSEDRFERLRARLRREPARIYDLPDLPLNRGRHQCGVRTEGAAFRRSHRLVPRAAARTTRRSAQIRRCKATGQIVDSSDPTADPLTLMSAPGGATGRGLRLFLGGLFCFAGVFAPICS